MPSDRSYRGDSEGRAGRGRAAAGAGDPEPSTANLGAGGEASPRPPRSPTPDLFARGEVVAGRFRISGPLGRGGGGQVYAAHDLLLGLPVALKTIAPDLAGTPGGFERLRAEVLAARDVTHPNVCRTFELFRHVVPGDGDRPETQIAVMAMELLEGETLAGRLRRAGPPPPGEAAAIAGQLADGLAAAHAAGVLHLDLKSANVVLVPAASGRRAVIADFGLARSTRRSGQAGGRGGTPGYMAPEQAAGGEVTPATDVHAFGCVVHEMLTGELPATVAGGRRVGAVAERWRRLLEACLAPAPADRPADGAALRAALPPARAGRRRWRVAAAAIALASAGLLPAPHEPEAPAAVAGSPATPLEARVDREVARGLRLLWLLEPASARRVLERAVAAVPGHVPARLALSEAWEDLGYLDRSRADVERAAAAAMDGAGREIRLWLEARLHETGGRAAEAADSYRTLHALRPDDLGHLARLLGAQFRSGRAEEAERILAPYLGRPASTAGDDARLALLEARVALELGNPERQLAAARRTADLAAGGRPGLLAAARMLESLALRTLGREDNGLAAAGAALDLHTRRQNPRERLAAIDHLASLHSQVTGESELARSEYERAIDLARRLGDRASEARLLVNLGAHGLLWGDLADAEQRFRRARSIHRELGNEAALATVAGNLAIIHLLRNSFGDAEREFEHALALRRRVGPPAAAANLLNNVAMLYARRGEPRRARDAWEECAALTAESGNRLLATIAAANLAHLALLEGDVGAAARRFDREVAPRLADLATPAVSAEAARVAGDIALARDRETEALTAAGEAVGLLEALGDRTRAAQARQQLAGVHLRYGRAGAAEEPAERAVAELIAAGRESDAAIGRYSLVQIRIAQGRLDETREVLSALVRGAPDDDVQHLLLAALAQGRVALAAAEPERAIARVERGVEVVPPGYLVPLRLEADLLLAAAEAALGRREESERRLRRLRADAERGGFVYFARRASEQLAAGDPGSRGGA